MDCFAAFERSENYRSQHLNICYLLTVYLRYSVGRLSSVTKELTHTGLSPIKRIYILPSDLPSDSFYCGGDDNELRFWEVSFQMMTFSKILYEKN